MKNPFQLRAIIGVYTKYILYIKLFLKYWKAKLIFVCVDNIFNFDFKNMEQRKSHHTEWDVYEGEYQDGKKHGHGVYLYLRRNLRYQRTCCREVEGCREVSIWIFILNKRILA